MSSNEKFCPDCGAKNERDAVFCFSCGKRFPEREPEMTKERSPKEIAMGGEDQQQRGFDQSEYFRQARGGKRAPSSSYDPQNVNTLEATKDMYVNPDQSALPLLVDPDAPTTVPLVLIRALTSALIPFLVASNTTLFTLLYGSQYNQLYNSTDTNTTAGNGTPTTTTNGTVAPELTFEQFQSAAKILYPVIAVIGVMGIWWVGSWLLGRLLTGGLAPNSPLRANVSGAMRQLNGYRQVPFIVLNIIVIIVMLLNPETLAYRSVLIFGHLIATFIAAIPLVRGIGQNVGYSGFIPKLFAGLAVLLSFFGFRF